MNKNHFDNLAKASTDFIKSVDSIIPDVQKNAAEDKNWAEFVQKDRREARAAYVAATINEGAATAKRKADAELDAMRAAFKKYMTTTSDPGALQSLQALIGAGVKLSRAEVEAFAASNDYATLRLLEPHSQGRVKAPDLTRFETDMKEIAFYFGGLSSYSGPACELADYTTAHYFGLPSKTAGTIVKGKADHFQATLDEIAARWSMVKEG